MARRSTTQKYSQPPQAPSGVNDPAMPQAVKDKINSAYQSANQDYSSGSFAAKHPILSNVAAAGIGGLLMGPLGLIAGPMANASHETNRKASISDVYNNVIKNTLENQKNTDIITQPRNETIYNQSLIDEAKRLGQIPSTAPDLYQRDLPGLDGTPAQQHDVPNYRPEFQDTVRKGLFAGNDINYLQGLQDYNRQINYAMPGNLLGGQNAGGGNGSEQQPFQTGATVQGQGPQAPAAPFFISDPQTIMQQVTSAGNEALGQGQKRYEFDKQEPNREAEVGKLKAEAATQVQLAIKYMQEGKSEEAHRALMAAQAAEARASASLKNRTNPNLSSGSQPNEASRAFSLWKAGKITDAEYAQTLGVKAPSLSESYQKAGLEDQANEKDWFGNPTPRAKIAQKALSAVGGTSGSINPQFQSPKGGNTVVKGQHGAYSF